MPIALPEPVSLAVEALDLEVAITAAETQDATAELPHEELFDVSTEDGVIQIVQRERYWKSKFAKRTSFLSFGGPKIVISLPHDSFLDVLRVQTNSTCRLEGVRTTHADLAATTGTIRCLNASFTHAKVTAKSSSVKMVDSTVTEDATLTVTGGSVTTTGTFTEMPGYRIEDVSGKVQILDQPCEPGDSHNAKGQPSVFINCIGGSVTLA